MTPPAGYSGTPLPRKLGIAAGHAVLLAGPPADLDLGPLPEGTTVQRRRARARYDMVVGFCPNSAVLRAQLPGWKQLLGPAGSLWLAWPKKTSGHVTDLGESAVRAQGLAAGLVDVKVCAIDPVWSGLKFVYRLSDRSNVSSTHA